MKKCSAAAQRFTKGFLKFPEVGDALIQQKALA
jgi:hypothetical protein